MSISASMIVDVTPRVVRGGSGDLEFNGFVFTKNPLASAVDIFTSASDVGEQFGFESPEYNFAQIYWAADELKTKTPNALYFGRLLTEATAAWIRGYKVTTTLDEFKAITDGSLTMSVNGTDIEATGIDLSTATSLSDVATIIAEKLTGTSGSYNSSLKSFIFTTTTQGSKATIGYPKASSTGTDLSEMLVLSESQGAALWQGTDAQSFAENMNTILGITQNWVTFTTIDEPSIEFATEMAKWVSANFGFLYFANTTETSAEVPSSTADMASKLTEAGVSYTAVTYGSYEYTAMFMGMIAATDFNATNGMKTYAFKRSSILAANVTDSSVASALKTKRYNFLGNFATRNAQFNVTVWATLIGDTYKYIDEAVGMIWFANVLQRAGMDGFSAVNRVPFNERGYTMVRLWLTDPINMGLKNALIEPGVVLSGAQKTSLMEAIGSDVSQEIYNNGYFLKVEDPGAQVRAERGSPDVSIFFTYGGAVHLLNIGVTGYF